MKFTYGHLCLGLVGIGLVGAFSAPKLYWNPLRPGVRVEVAESNFLQYADKTLTQATLKGHSCISSDSDHNQRVRCDYWINDMVPGEDDPKVIECHYQMGLFADRGCTDYNELQQVGKGKVVL